MTQSNPKETDEKFAIIGLGYVGLPVAVAFGRKWPGTVGFDINQRRIEQLNAGTDVTGEVSDEEMRATQLVYTADETDLAECTFFIVAVPTPIDEHRRPDLTAVIKASETVGRNLKPGDVVVYESTVYPGVTEDVCGPVLERVSGLKQGVDFKLGYSPERINPGDREHTFERIVKVVSGEDDGALMRVAAAYGSVVDAGVFEAASIKVAEAAKVIENTQRDLNIALMNELAVIFDQVGIRTRDVLDAAGTKWNFLPFEPGLVGGHCIGVDPYYLTTMAEGTGYNPEVILAGRRINESMGRFVAQRLVKHLIHQDVPIRSARVGVLGLTFKPDITDLRNTKVIDVLTELQDFGIEPMLHEPMADPAEVSAHYGITLTPWDELENLDALILAVPHRSYREMSLETLLSPIADGGVFYDVKSRYNPADVSAATSTSITYWSL